MTHQEPARSAESDELDALFDAEGATDVGSEGPPPGSDDSAAPEDVVEDAEEVVAEDELAALARERDEYLDALRRLQAEFDNYRKRVTRQQTELLDRAAGSLIERLLPTLDALDLALAHTGETSDPAAAKLGAVLAQITSLMRDTLAKEGLERIDEVEVGFDPVVHDAVAHDPAEPGDSRGVLVAELLRPGYRLKGNVIRPAMVRVRG